MFAEPQEYRNEERMLTKMLDQLKNGRLPAELLPLLRNFNSAVMESPCSRCLLLALSHDELGVIVDGLADPLQPVVAVALSSTCKGLRTPLRAALEVLRQLHEKAKALGREAGTMNERLIRVALSCADLSGAEELNWRDSDLTADDLATLGLILPWMPRLKKLVLYNNNFSNAGAQALCEGLGQGAAPSLRHLDLGNNNFGPSGAEAISAAFIRGAMPKLDELYLSQNGIGKRGIASLAPALKRLPALNRLDLGTNEIGDEGVASLLDNVGKDDFKALETLYLDDNMLTDKGCAAVLAALKGGALPAIEALYHPDEADVISVHASEEACAAVDAALIQRYQHGA